MQVGEFELQAEDLVVETAPREAYAIASEPGCQVGVLKELTPELRAEGVVREAVHMINNLRRESGFAIADRISPLYQCRVRPPSAGFPGEGVSHSRDTDRAGSSGDQGAL